MATERLRKTREILRQKWELGRTHREVAASVGLSLGAVALTLGRAAAAGLDWAAAQALSEGALEERLYGPRDEVRARPMPDCEYLHAERKKPGVTLELLHHEYLEKHPDGYRYTQFCERYREWLKRRGLTMRQEHLAGEKLFVDYAGKKPHIVDPKTGEVIDAELFVAVLGASNYTYAEATHTQRGPDFIASHVRALRYLGGVSAALVPDQLKTGITSACRYEPGIQRTYEDLARHYGTTVLPARPRRPRDKAKVEVAVQIRRQHEFPLPHRRLPGARGLPRRVRGGAEPEHDLPENPSGLPQPSGVRQGGRTHSLRCDHDGHLGEPGGDRQGGRACAGLLRQHRLRPGGGDGPVGGEGGARLLPARHGTGRVGEPEAVSGRRGASTPTTRSGDFAAARWPALARRAHQPSGLPWS
jgi:transposase